MRCQWKLRGFNKITIKSLGTIYFTNTLIVLAQAVSSKFTTIHLIKLENDIF